MRKIIKTTEGSADFLLNEEYENEDKAIQGKEPANADIKIQELKIENIKYKLKKVINEKS